MRTRRALLAASGGAAALVLAGLGYRGWDRGLWTGGKGPAYSPWGGWQGQISDSIRRPVRAAILAASPHDTQPWLFEARDSTITVFADRARNLGTFDPFRREMHLGLGAAIENLSLAARAFGLAAQVVPAEGTLTLSPVDTVEVAARIVLAPTPATADALYGAIPNRHTNRGPYHPDEAIAAVTLRRLGDLAASDVVRPVFIKDRQARSELGALIVQATERIIGDAQMSADSARWFRTGHRDIAAHQDGVTVDTAGVSPFLAAVSKVLPDLDGASADRHWLSMTSGTQVPSAPVLGMLLVRDRLDMGVAIQAGRAWQRLHLAATAEGLAAQPLNQPVECIDRDAMLGRANSFGPDAARLAQAPGWEPTFMFRLGVPERAAGPSPRRPFEEVWRA